MAESLSQQFCLYRAHMANMSKANNPYSPIWTQTLVLSHSAIYCKVHQKNKKKMLTHFCLFTRPKTPEKSSAIKS